MNAQHRRNFETYSCDAGLWIGLWDGFGLIVVPSLIAIQQDVMRYRVSLNAPRHALWGSRRSLQRLLQSLHGLRRRWCTL